MSDFPGGFDPRMFEGVPLFREIGKVLSWRGGPINYDIAADSARSIAATARGVDDAEAQAFADAVRVAELWLDQVTALPAVGGPARALSPSEWLAEAVGPRGLGAYIEPLAGGMSAAVERQLPEEMRAMAGQLGQAMNAVGAMMYGVQLGTVAGHMAGQLLGVYDLGVPTVDPRIAGMVGRTASQFAADYEFDATEFRYWLALREAAHRRLFAGVTWLRPRVVSLIGRFGAESDMDPNVLLEGLGGFGFDPTNPEALSEALSQPDAFRVEPTTAQKAVLSQLQAIVAFVEGWSETVVRAAAAEKLPAIPRILEAVRRRRAEKGPGEQFLQQLLGLDLKPADMRAGVAFCDAVIAARGAEALDAVWQDERLLPDAADLVEPSRWLLRYAAAEIEAQIEADHGPLDEGESQG
jgi:putative hydrolase